MVRSPAKAFPVRSANPANRRIRERFIIKF
jgi:hypothetical protein